MARRTYIEETQDPVTGEVTVLEANNLSQLDTIAKAAEKELLPAEDE